MVKNKFGLGINDYVYQTQGQVQQNTPGEITGPTPGSTLTTTSVNFEWNEGVGVEGFWLHVGQRLGEQMCSPKIKD